MDDYSRRSFLILLCNLFLGVINFLVPATGFITHNYSSSRIVSVVSVDRLGLIVALDGKLFRVTTLVKGINSFLFVDAKWMRDG